MRLTTSRDEVNVSNRSNWHFLNTPTSIMKYKILQIFLSIACLMPMLVGCNRIVNWLEEATDTHLDWTEDVQLQDGSVLLVSRTARLSANSIAGGGGGSFNKGMTIEFKGPSNAGLPGPWSDVYVPMLLDRDPVSGEWLLVATFFHCDSWYRLGRPPLPYTEYRFREGKWQRQPLSKHLIGRTANLYIADRQTMAAHMTKELKEISIPSGASEKYLKIVSVWTTGC